MYILIPIFHGFVSRFRLVTVGEFAVARPTERFSRIVAGDLEARTAQDMGSSWKRMAIL